MLVWQQSGAQGLLVTIRVVPQQRQLGEKLSRGKRNVSCSCISSPCSGPASSTPLFTNYENAFIVCWFCSFELPERFSQPWGAIALLIALPCHWRARIFGKSVPLSEQLASGRIEDILSRTIAELCMAPDWKAACVSQNGYCTDIASCVGIAFRKT